MWIYIIVGITLIMLGYLFILYNRFIKQTNQIKEAFSTMDVYLKKRWDLIPNMIEIVKGYTKHEQTTLEEVVKLRNHAYDNMSNEDKIMTNEELSKHLPKLLALVENYPELKASDQYKDLSMELTKVEDELVNSRKYYNATIRNFNNIVEMFPNNIAAKLLGFKAQKMFQINEEERNRIKVKL